MLQIKIDAKYMRGNEQDNDFFNIGWFEHILMTPQQNEININYATKKHQNVTQFVILL